MTRTAAQVLVDRLIDWEVDTVFGLPGDGINGLMEALRRRRDRLRFESPTGVLARAVRRAREVVGERPGQDEHGEGS